MTSIPDCCVASSIKSGGIGPGGEGRGSRPSWTPGSPNTASDSWLPYMSCRVVDTPEVCPGPRVRPTLASLDVVARPDLSGQSVATEEGLIGQVCSPHLSGQVELGQPVLVGETLWNERLEIAELLDVRAERRDRHVASAEHGASGERRVEPTLTAVAEPLRLFVFTVHAGANKARLVG